MKRVFALTLAVLAVVFLPSCASTPDKCEFFAMDTYMSLSVYGDDGGLAKAEALIKQLDTLYSVSSEDGEVFSLNKNGTLTAPSHGLLEMLECAKVLYERTNGMYDITAYTLSSLWKRCENEGRIPTDSEIAEALSFVGMDKLSFDESKVELSSAGGIDLGSVAKGYAAKKAEELLKEKSTAGIINLGGNVAVYGKKPNGESWKIGIADPKSPNEACGYITLSGGSVVTSGKYNRTFEVDGKSYHHIINTKTGYPCENGVASVTVICDDGMWADALATALFLMGEQGALEYYREYGGFEAVIITDDGRIVVTSEKAAFTAV